MSDMISIIIPAYNAADYLAQTIESVLNQTYSDFELILIDDGSLRIVHVRLLKITNAKMRE